MLSQRSRRGLAAAFLPALLLLATLSACGGEEAPERQRLTVTQLSNEAQQHFGETVTVSGRVDRVFGEASFSMSGRGESVLVVFVAPSAQVQGPRSDAQPFAKGDSARVTGRVRRFASAVTERDADQKVNIDYADENPALVASQVVLTPR